MQPMPVDVAEFFRPRRRRVNTHAGREPPAHRHRDVKAYTRGRGFTAGEPSEDLWLIIVPVCARLTANPNMTAESSIDDY